MASDLGLSLSGYAKLERNETDITVSKLYKVAEILKVSVNKILNFNANNVFNIENNKMLQCTTGVEHLYLHNHQSNYADKYIAILEREIERLKALLENKG